MGVIPSWSYEEFDDMDKAMGWINTEQPYEWKITIGDGVVFVFYNNSH